jgi:hypothetical protein
MKFALRLFMFLALFMHIIHYSPSLCSLIIDSDDDSLLAKREMDSRPDIIQIGARINFNNLSLSPLFICVTGIFTKQSEGLAGGDTRDA